MANETLINYQSLADAVAMDPAVKAQLWTKYLERGSRFYDCFSHFESAVSASPSQNVGKAGIVATTQSLSAIGGDKINMTVASAPGGRGAIGEEMLKGKESKSKFKTYSVIVDWHRDAVAFTKKQLHMMAAGGNLERDILDMLKEKMGIWKQNDMMMALLHLGNGNIYRPNARTSRNAIGPNDTLSVSMSVAAKARLNTMGAKPISHTMGTSGDHINGFLTFASEFAFLDIRNDTGYQNALQQASARGKANDLYTGKLVTWQGQNFYEHIVSDQDWDDYVGSPIQPKAIMHANVAAGTVVFSAASAAGACVLKGSSTNTDNLYFQFWPGFAYRFTEDFILTDGGGSSLTPDSTLTPLGDDYYCWAINPDGTVAFLSYDGADNTGNQITVKNILSAAAGTSTKGATTVGAVTVAGSGVAVNGTTRVITPGADANTPAGFTYVDKVQTGAVLIPCNSYGVPIGYGFTFGARAAARAYGKIKLNKIKQDDDYDFITANGFEMVFGQSPTINANGVTNNYLILEFAIEHEGYPVPSIDQYAA